MALANFVPSVTYHLLPAPPLPPNFTKNPVELFFEIPRLNNPKLPDSLLEISEKSRIRALVLDVFCNSAFEVCESLKIPTYYYFSAGSAMVVLFMYFATLDDTMRVDLGELNDYVEMPGLPPIYSLDFPKDVYSRGSLVYKHVLEVSKNLQKSRGVMVNAFDALEMRAKEAISNGLCLPNGATPPVYYIGPLVEDVKAEEEHECLSWLDKQPSKSVVFLCFGRRGLFSAEQLKETAVGLEKSGHRFLWSLRTPPVVGSAEGGAEPRLGGGFVTHCGRSSVSEALWFGVPMIGWPVYAEQRMNRVVMVEEMRVALPLEEVAPGGGSVAAAELEKRVRELMESKTGRDLRRRLTEMKSSARAAVAQKGSSVIDLQNLLHSTILD
nr:flavonoid 7-O-glucuronosyltransferase [Scutellaria baicalensis]